jgi:hypothetical protein
MSHTSLRSIDTPVNAIRLVCLDQFARVAATGIADALNGRGCPPATETTQKTAFGPSLRLNKTWVPSGEKQGHKSKWSDVRNLTGAVGWDVGAAQARSDSKPPDIMRAKKYATRFMRYI